VAPRLRCIRIEKRAERKPEPRKSSREEHVMMFAFALAVIGIVVLETLELVAARA